MSNILGYNQSLQNTNLLEPKQSKRKQIGFLERVLGTSGTYNIRIWNADFNDTKTFAFSTHNVTFSSSHFLIQAMFEKNIFFTKASTNYYIYLPKDKYPLTQNLSGTPYYTDGSPGATPFFDAYRGLSGYSNKLYNVLSDSSFTIGYNFSNYPNANTMTTDGTIFTSSSYSFYNMSNGRQLTNSPVPFGLGVYDGDVLIGGDGEVYLLHKSTNKFYTYTISTGTWDSGQALTISTNKGAGYNITCNSFTDGEGYAYWHGSPGGSSTNNGYYNRWKVGTTNPIESIIVGATAFVCEIQPLYEGDIEWLDTNF